MAEEIKNLEQDIESTKEKTAEERKLEEKEAEEKKRLMAEEEKNMRKKRAEKLSQREKKKLTESAFFHFLQKYWLIVGFFLMNVIILVAFFIIKNMYVGLNAELTAISTEKEEAVVKWKKFLETWERQMTIIQEEKLVDKKIEKKETIMKITDKYTKRYVVVDNEKGEVILKIAKNEIVGKNIPIMILELKAEKLNFSVKGMSQEVSELNINFSL